MLSSRLFLLLLVLCSGWDQSPFGSAKLLAENLTVTEENMLSFRLPRMHVQFICHDNILRSGFDVETMFNEYYSKVLANVSSISLEQKSRSSTMRDIPPTKWYYNRCNISSPQVLLTMESDGWAHYDKDHREGSVPSYEMNTEAFDQYVMQTVTSASLQSYIEEHVCGSMEIYRAIVEDAVNLTAASFDDDDRFLEHSTILLCGGEHFIYDDYDAEDVDSGFVVFGMIVGVVMVSMIVGELQQLQRRPNPSSSRRSGGDPDDNSETERSSRRRQRRSRRRNRRRDDYALTPTEVEMV